MILTPLQAVNRQIGLEQQLHTLKENEQALQTLQEALSQLDHTLTSFLTDRIDAFQLPQEAQVPVGRQSGGEPWGLLPLLTSLSASLEKLNSY